MATIRIVLLKDRKNAKGEHPIALRLADANNKRTHFYTGFRSTEQYFDTSKDGGRFFQGKGIKAFTVERKEEDGSTKVYTNKEANDKLAALEERAHSIIRKYNEDHVNWGFDQFRTDFTNAPKRELFLSFAELVIEEEYRKQGKFKTANIAMEAIKSLQNYDSTLASKAFQDINARYLKGYMDYCRNNGNTETTLKIRLGEIRRIYNIAIREKVVSPELYPFSSGKEDGKVRIPKSSPTRTDQYLSTDSMKKLARTSFKDFVKERTRHLFLFSYHCRGMNWKDMALLKKSCFYKKTITDEVTKQEKEGLFMEYRRSKTKGEFEILVTPNIQRELDWFKANTPLFKDYVLPIIRVDVTPEKMDAYISQVRKRFNRSLRDVASDLGLPESEKLISSYTARHSFAMTLQKLDKPVEIISQALGHQSVETTKHYLAKFSTTRMAEETDINLLDD